MAQPIAYYYDDNKQEAENLISRINSLRGLDVQYKEPPQNLDVPALGEDARLFMVDWALDEARGDQASVPYKGSSLASRLREKFPEIPIILITKKSNIDQRSVRRYIQSLNLFDQYITKDHLRTNSAEIVERSLRLIKGYDQLKSAEKTFSGLLEVLGADDSEGQLVGTAIPPLAPEEGEKWDIAETARWIDDVFLKYPGIVYDPLHAATYLGISKSYFMKNDLQEVFQPARYAGAFEPIEGRWWRGRLVSIAEGIMSEAEIDETSVTRAFGPAFNRISGTEIEPSICVSSGEYPADWVCYVLKAPVKIEYSLSYYPDSRPPAMDEARVSFKAIRESNEVFDEYFDASSQALLEEIREF